jgi:Sel1 repeat-containing protein
MSLITEARSLRSSDKKIFDGICGQMPNKMRKALKTEIYLKLKFSTEKETDDSTTPVLKKLWEGNHLLEYFKDFAEEKKTISKTRFEKILYQYGFAKSNNEFVNYNDFKNQFSSGFGNKKPKKLFFVLATAQQISVLKCLVQFVKFCLDKNRPLHVEFCLDKNGSLQYFHADKKSFDRYVETANKILQANKNKTKNKFDLSALTLLKEDREKLEKYIKDAKEYLEKNPEKCFPQADFEDEQDTDDTIDNHSSKNTSTSVTPSHKSNQPELTKPQADEENKNYYASAAIKKVIGRTAQEKRLEDFLECKLNVAWFQLAGEAGQGKSRLAFDLMHKALNSGWCAGFVEEDDIEFFKNHGKNWQPNKRHLLIFDYVIGREEEIKYILKALLPKLPNQRKYQHDIRILLLERQRWDRGSTIKKQAQEDKGESGLSAYISDKAQWFLNLCKQGDFEGKSLKPSRFENGVEELKELDQDDLVTIVKQLFSGKKLAISNEELKKTLERIDNSGRPLYAYLLAHQLSDSQVNFQSWTKIDLLNYQLIRDKERRWGKAFKGDTPIWGDHHPAMKLAVLATIIGTIKLQDTRIEQYFGHIDSSLGKEAVAITSGYLINNNKRPHEIHALKPDLLGEWFVLYCFLEGLGFEELLDIAWQYWPNDTASFLQRITQDFIDLSKEDKSWDITEKLLTHKPPQENHYQALANVAVSIASKLYQRKLTVPQNIITALEYAVNLSDTAAMSGLGFFYGQGIGVERNPEKAIDLYQQAVELGNSLAMFNLGVCYENGEGVKQDLDKAIDLYQQAIELGNSDAMVNLGVCYQNGEGVEQNWDKVDLYQQAVELGNSQAMFNLGVCYQKGEGVEQNWDKAIDLYQQAVELGNSLAMTNLGICYEKGQGVEQDWSKAIDLYQQASIAGEEIAVKNLQNILLIQNFLGEGHDNKWKTKG